MSIVSGLLLSLFAGLALALVTPDASEMTRLQGLLSAAQAADVALVTADRRAQRGDVAPSVLEGYRNSRERAWKSAIDAVLISYDLALPSREDPSVAIQPKVPFTHGKHEGETRKWVVRIPLAPLGDHLGGAQKDIEALDAQADRVRANATTAEDGTTILFKGDYESPAALARTLFHERHHFRQFAEAKFKDMTLPEMEVDAWTLVLNNIDKFGFTDKQLKAERKRAGYMVMKETLKSFTARGQRNMAWFGTAIRERLASGLGDIEPVATSHEGISLDPALAATLREDAERLNESIASEAAGRKLAEIAGKFCERGWRREFLVEQYAAVRVPTGEPTEVPSGSCREQVFSLLWRGKKAGLDDPDWHMVDEAVASGGSSIGPCRPSPGFPCPTLSEPVTAIRAQAPVPAVAARLPAHVALAQPQDRLGWLRDLARKGCSDPWAYPQEELDRYWGALLGMAYDEEAPARLGLEGCRDRLFRTLMRMAADRSPETLTQEVFARTAEGAKNSGAVYTTDEFPDIPGPQSPDVPTCRHHPWCQTWGGR